MTATPVASSAERPGRLLGRLHGADIGLAVAAAVCLALVVVALCAPWIAPCPPLQTDILNQGAGSSAQHLLGTDVLGRDILSRLIYGTRLSLLGPTLVVVLSLTAGTALAVAAAWHGKLVDRTVSRLFDVLLAFPGLVIAILAVAVFGTGITAPVLALSLGYVPYIGRVARSIALRERRLPYVEALLLAGIPAWRICLRHIVPNLWPVIRAQAFIAFGSALIDLGGISFLGLGVQPPTPEWGEMVSEGRSALLGGSPQECLYAGGMIVLAVVAFNVLGERLARRAEQDR